MQTEPAIAFENIEPSEFVRGRILREVARLERFFGRGIACRVVVHAPDGRRRKGDLYSVRVHVQMPGQREVVVNRQPPARKSLADPYVAIHQAFKAARRQLQDQARSLRGDVKVHDEQGIGKISAYYPEDGYGLITTPDGDEIHFDRSSMPGEEFDSLELGASVGYQAHEGDYRIHARVARARRASSDR
jgi:cold shock CspA family protein/ribosome-associated translation inhibitor RaiA